MGRAVALLALLLTLGAVRGQTASKGDLGVNVTFGWQGQMPSEKWSPITVSITTEENMVAGVLVVEFEQDSMNMARYSTPFVATSGVMSQAQILVALPELCSRVSLSLENESGTTVWSQTYGRVPQGVSQPLPPFISPETPVIGVVGRSSLPEAMRDWPGIMGAFTSTDYGKNQNRTRATTFGRYDAEWSGLAGVHVDPMTLPTSWMGYDGLFALVAIPDSSKPPSPRAVEAIHRWVAAGGRLIIQADQPGEAWRDWLPPGLTLSLDAARRGAVPEEIRAALTAVVQTVGSIPTDMGRPAGSDGPLPASAESVLQRIIRVQPELGWTTLLAASPDSGALIVEHTLGFGTVCVVGVDPAKTTDLVSALGAGAAWRGVLEPVVEDLLEQRAKGSVSNNRWGVVTQVTRAAVNAGLERVANIPGLGGSVFALIMACVLVLAVMVGPVDYFVLKRAGALQRSWMTAGAWILVAGTLAFFGPRILRTEPTRVNRVSVVDCIVPSISGATDADLAAIGGPVAFAGGVTGIYSGDAGVVQFMNPEATSWWRGASVQYDGVGSGSGTALVPIAQRAAGGASGSERAAPLVKLPMPLWTFRTFTDMSVSLLKLSGRVRATNNGWTAMISGLPPGAHVVKAALRVGPAWMTSESESRVREDGVTPAVTNAPAAQRAEKPEAKGTLDGGVWSNVFGSTHDDKYLPVAWADAAEAQAVYWGIQAIDKRPGAITSLPGAAGRAHGIDALLATNRWGAVYLEVTDWPVETPVSWAFQGEHTRILRVLVPLEGS